MPVKHTLVARLLVVAVFVAFIRQGGAQVSCYDCNSAPAVSGSLDINSCGSFSSNLPLAYNCTYCTESASANSYSRGCATTPPIPALLGCSSTGFGSSQCYCNTTNCNNHPLMHSGSVSCYVCTSLDFIENGCGQTFNPNSPDVKTFASCVACARTISSSADGGIYTRSCIRSLSPANSCGGSTSNSCGYTCSTSLCNHASQLARTSTLLLSVILAGLAILRQAAVVSPNDHAMLVTNQLL